MIRPKAITTALLTLLLVLYSSSIANAYSNEDRKNLAHAEAYLRNSSYFRAIEYLSKVIKNNKNVAMLHAERGKSYFKIGYDKEALKDLNLAIKLAPTNAQYHKWRGDAHELAGNFDKALKDYDYALAHGGGSLWAINYKKGKLYVSIENYPKALEYLNKAIVFHQKSNHSAYDYKDDERTLFKTRSQIYYNQKKYQAAIKDMTSAIASGAYRDQLYMSRADMYNQAKDYPKAIADYTTVLKKNPADDGAYENRARLQLKTGAYQKALYDVNKAIEMYLGENYSRLYKLRADIYDKLGKKSLAAKDRNRAVGY